MSKVTMFVISLLCDTFPISTPIFMAHIENTKLEHVKVSSSLSILKIGR